MLWQVLQEEEETAQPPPAERLRLLLLLQGRLPVVHLRLKPPQGWQRRALSLNR